ncbi:MAG: hypothetical protein COA43_14535 [Robiginitomaculum sp.]|nr:MAG: hypothetical protein COA43_14535 [Robiginitomaculum sp.]
MTCTVAQSIAVIADEPEQLSISEMLSIMINGGSVEIQGERWGLEDIEKLFTESEMLEAHGLGIRGDGLATYNLYINAIGFALQ